MSQLPLLFNNRLIVSLFDYTGNWAKPYIDAGYPVMLWDYKVEGDILTRFSSLLQEIDIRQEEGYELHGVLMAPPCTEFAGSGAQWWAGKDQQACPDENFADWTITEHAIALVEIALTFVDNFKPHWWVLENPVGRLETCVPSLKPWRRLSFNPCDYGDAYTKKTILWGNFNPMLVKRPVEPEFITWAGKRFPAIYKGTGGKSEKTKTIRSTTPMGFAKAFFNANP